jgi:cytochrome c oxidase subunit IV
MRLGKTQTQTIIMMLVLLGIYAIFYLIGYITYLVERFNTSGLTIVTFQVVLVYLIYDKVCQLNKYYHKNWPSIGK